jgi:hypothetical protein
MRTEGKRKRREKKRSEWKIRRDARVEKRGSEEKRSKKRTDESRRYGVG